MKFLGIGKVTKDDDGKVTERCYVAELTEAEADMITGVAGKPHISGRYKPGIEVNVTAVYQKVKRINEKYAEIKAAVIAVKTSADDIDNAIPLT
ncbi:hypothetical protein LCGC14_0403440 [marine sediment metagenome]|uniref:Uncharacterized protein n=1 Tax=marine sediment metagenome TaxID=412755 RepID=A0A0F9VI28_9ZZZZ